MPLGLTKNFRIAEDMKAIIPLSKEKTPFLDLFKRGTTLIGEILNYYESFTRSEEGTITGANLNTTDITFAVNTELAASLFQGTLIMVEGEQMMVDSKSGNNITVFARGFGSTAVTSHNIGAKVYLLSKAEADGDITEDFNKIVKVKRENYMQEFTKSINISKRILILKNKDYTTVKGEELIDKSETQRREITKQLIYGRAVLDTTGGRNSMGGVLQAISLSNGVVLDAAGDLTEAKMSTVLSSLALRGSKVTHIALNPVTKDAVFKKFKNTIYEDKQGQKNQKGSGNMISYISNAMDGRELLFLVDNNIKTSDMIFVTEEDLIINACQEGDEDILIRNEVEFEKSSRYNSTIRSMISAQFQSANKMAHISNVA